MEEKKCQGAEDYGPEVAGKGEEELNNTLMIEVVRRGWKLTSCFLVQKYLHVHA